MLTLSLDVFPLIRPFFFLLDPEVAHEVVIKCMKFGLSVTAPLPKDPILKTTFCGRSFEHPVGLAAGFDKNGEVIDELFRLGFSFVELGTVTPKPQPGNPKPRLFRIPASEAIINRFGFNNIGIEAFARHVAAYRAAHPAAQTRTLGLNVGKNKETADAIDDYVVAIRKIAALADYITVNVSSPNTPGLRDMQERGALTELLAACLKARNENGPQAKLLLKIAPDISDAQAEDIAAVALQSGIDGMIVSNTTITRPDYLPAAIAKEAGGLSGRPLTEMSTKVLGRMYQLTQGKLPLIGVGGVFNGADAYAKIRAGATLVQIYTAMVYRGPQAIAAINRELIALLKRDGFASISDAVGADFKK